MIKFALLFFFCISVLSLKLNAQQFNVSDIQGIDINGDTCIFPLLSGKNKKAAQKINTYLQIAVLSKIGASADSIPYSNVFPVEGEYWGGSLYSYHINNNDSKFFSVTISYDYTGAYTERFEQYFNFISATGEHVLLEDFFAETPLSTIGEIINQRFANSIETFMTTIDTLSEDGNEQYAMYEECLKYMKDNTEIYGANFFIEDSNFVFVKERCSNHAMAYYDELCMLNEAMSFELLSNFFNQNGSDIYNGGKWDSKRSSINEKILNGKINKKYAITAKFEYNQFENYLEGVYWYDNYKIPIYLYGELKEDGTFVLEIALEKTAEKVISETFTGIIQDGVFKGTWSNANKTLKFPFLLSIN
ncbi:MAG: hypothetical protein RI883_408 [Bacteroidota bacterium]